MVSASAAAMAPACLLHRTGGARAPLGQNAVERTANQKSVGRYQQNEQDHRRHRAEHKFTELIQYLVHEWDRLGPLWKSCRQLSHTATLFC